MGNSREEGHYSRTLPRQLCGARALKLLPKPREWQRGEVLLRGEPLEKIDAWGGASLRCLIEYLGRYRQGRTHLWACDDADAWRHLCAFLAEDRPAHLILPPDVDGVLESSPPEVVLPALPVRSEEKALELAGRVLDTCGEMPVAARFVAKYLPVLVMNSLEHADSPVPPVVCAYHDRENEVLQLVVVDLGRRKAPFTQRTLTKRVESPSDGSLKTLVESAKERKLNVSLDIVAGSGCLHWRNGSRRAATAEKIFGFCSAITVPL